MFGGKAYHNEKKCLIKLRVNNRLNERNKGDEKRKGDDGQK